MSSYIFNLPVFFDSAAEKETLKQVCIPKGDVDEIFGKNSPLDEREKISYIQSEIRKNSYKKNREILASGKLDMRCFIDSGPRLPKSPEPDSSQPQKGRANAQDCELKVEKLFNKKNFSLATAVITAPRSVSTLSDTLKSITSAGFQAPIVFAEPKSELSSIDESLVVRNQTTLGNFRNWLNALRSIRTKFPNASGYVLFEDDVKVTPDLYDWLKYELWPFECSVVSLYTSSCYLSEKHGWAARAMGGYRHFGSLGYVINPALTDVILDSETLKKHLKPDAPKRTKDYILGDFFFSLGVRVAYHSPTLIEHTGETSSLRQEKLFQLTFDRSKICENVNSFDIWTKPNDLPRITLVGWNTRQGLGYINRDIVKFLPIERWVIPKHPEFQPINDYGESNCKIENIDKNINHQEFKKMTRGSDWLLFAEHPINESFAGLARENWTRVACIAMHEWLSPTLRWINYVDLFICPTMACYKMLKKWKNIFGFTWDLIYIPQPVDIEKYKFEHRLKCKNFLFNNGNGGGCARFFDSKWNITSERSNPRKGSYELAKAGEKASKNFKIIFRSQPERPNFPPHPNLNDKFVKIGEVDSNELLYNSGDISIQPSLYEGVGLQALEAQCCGLPVITTDAAPMNEFNPLDLIKVKRKSSASLIDGNIIDVCYPDESHLAELMDKWFDRDISQKSIEARSFIEKNHNWSVSASKFIKAMS